MEREKPEGGYVPYDVETIKEILHSMGVKHYQPEVLNQLTEFLYSKHLLFKWFSLGTVQDMYMK